MLITVKEHGLLRALAWWCIGGSRRIRLTDEGMLLYKRSRFILEEVRDAGGRSCALEAGPLNPCGVES